MKQEHIEEINSLIDIQIHNLREEMQYCRLGFTEFNNEINDLKFIKSFIADFSTFINYYRTTQYD